METPSIYVNEHEVSCNMNIACLRSNVRLPEDANVYLECKGKSYYLGIHGQVIIKLLNRETNFHATTTSFDIAHIFESGPFKPQDKKTWLVTYGAFEDDPSKLPEFSVVYLYKNNKNLCTALHIRDGLSFCKIGTSSMYCFATLDFLKEIYNTDAIRYSFLGLKCHGCSQEKTIDDLFYCGICGLVTFCSTKCQVDYWQSHRKVCQTTYLLDDPAEKPTYLFVPDCRMEKHLITFGVSGDVLDWFRKIFQMCNTCSIPCTRLRELDAIIGDPNQEKFDFRINDTPFCIEKLKKNTIQLMVRISSADIMSFEEVETWEKDWSSSYEIYKGKIEENTLYQFPCVLRLGYFSKSCHFKMDEDEYSLEFYK